MMGYGFDGGWMWVFGVLTLAGLTLLVSVAVRAFGGGITRTTAARGAPPGNAKGAETPRSPARQVLDERYARGELSTEEYRERLQTLAET